MTSNIDQHIINLYPNYTKVAYIKRENIEDQLYLTFKNANVKINSHFLDMDNNPIKKISYLEILNYLNFANSTSTSITNLNNLNFKDDSTSTSINNLNNLNFRNTGNIRGDTIPIELGNAIYIRNTNDPHSINLISIENSGTIRCKDLVIQNLFTSSGNITTSNGNITTANGHITTSIGNITTSSGNIVTYGGNISSSGDITSSGDISCRNITSSGDITSTGNIISDTIIMCNDLSLNTNISSTNYIYFNTDTLYINFEKALLTKIISVPNNSEIKNIHFNNESSIEQRNSSQVIIHIVPVGICTLYGKDNITTNQSNNLYMNYEDDIECSNSENTSIVITATNINGTSFFLSASLFNKK
jgi:hypothetical protein